MNQPRVFEDAQRVEELRGEDFHELRAQALELVLLDQLVKVGREELEDETKMVFVDEGVSQPQYVVLVLRVALII